MTDLTDARFAVVMPIYEDREASTRLFKELRAEYGSNAYIVAVDDGSVNQPVEASAIFNAGLDGGRVIDPQRGAVVLGERGEGGGGKWVHGEDGAHVQPFNQCHLFY